MRVLVFLAAVSALFGFIGVAQADHLENENYSDRDPESEFYVCHTPDHANDRFVYNRRDRDFCNDVLSGHVQFYERTEAIVHVRRSLIICYQRSRLCKAPGT